MISLTLLTAFPEAPLLEGPLSAETDTEMTVTCDILGVFPAEKAEFELSFAGKKLDPNTSVFEERARAQALVFPPSAGSQELICTVSLGPVTRTVKKTVNVYSEYQICNEPSQSF